MLVKLDHLQQSAMFVKLEGFWGFCATFQLEMQNVKSQTLPANPTLFASKFQLSPRGFLGSEKSKLNSSSSRMLRFDTLKTSTLSPCKSVLIHTPVFWDPCVFVFSRQNKQPFFSRKKNKTAQAVDSHVLNVSYLDFWEAVADIDLSA